MASQIKLKNRSNVLFTIFNFVATCTPPLAALAPGYFSSNQPTLSVTSDPWMQLFLAGMEPRRSNY